MFGLSFSELVVIGVVALVAVGPQKLPGMLRTLGEWARKLRILTHEMRTQSGIDDILRSEGIHGGLSELRGLVRGNHFQIPGYTPAYTPPAAPPPATEPAASIHDPYAGFEVDPTKEYPPEGPDAYGALPDDLVDGAYLEAATDEPVALDGAEVAIANSAAPGTAVVEPAVVEPAVVEPAVVEPAVVEPAVVEPAADEAAPPLPPRAATHS